MLACEVMIVNAQCVILLAQALACEVMIVNIQRLILLVQALSGGDCECTVCDPIGAGVVRC